MSESRISILFVCLGNICRSPLAESIFRKLVKDRGLSDHFLIDSAGTSGYHNGESPDRRTVNTARERGVEVSGRSRQLKSSDLQTYEYVIVMDAENYEGVSQLARASGVTPTHLHMLREWDVESPGAGVPDPYFGGPNGFDNVHDIVERSCAALLDQLVAEAGLE